jgi:starch synthase
MTVSPNYGHEITTDEGGFNLQEFVRRKANDRRLNGILNGIDESWNPSNDPHIAKNYGTEDFQEGKAACKADLQKTLGLHEDPSVAIIGFVGRLTWQKGIDIVGKCLEWLMEDTGNGVTGCVQVVMMGNGEKEHADMLKWAELTYPGRVCGFVGFDSRVEHQMMAGCDLLLMPSRYEPCGLPQMYSQLYGTLPIVTETGGLKDSVKSMEEAGLADATGFKFLPLTEDRLKQELFRALELFHQKKQWFQQMQQNAMRGDFYWPRAMDEYEEVIDLTRKWNPQ